MILGTVFVVDGNMLGHVDVDDGEAVADGPFDVRLRAVNLGNVSVLRTKGWLRR